MARLESENLDVSWAMLEPPERQLSGTLHL